MPEPLIERPLHGPPTLFKGPIHIQIQMAQDPCDLYDRITYNALAANQKAISRVSKSNCRPWQSPNCSLMFLGIVIRPLVDKVAFIFLLYGSM